MVDFFSSAAVQVLLILFIWVPFALGAYLDEHFDRARARRSVRKLLHPLRHDGAARPPAAATA